MADSAGADDALGRALSIAPFHVAARIVYADNLKVLGRIDEAAAAYRDALREDAGAAHAWWGLANLKTVRFDAADADALAARFEAGNAADRAVLGFALAKALEDQDRYAEALDVLHEANALRRRQQPWDAGAFGREIDAIIAAFSTMPRETGQSSRGSEVVFVVSLPRAGSTLVEQIIAAHPDVEGAGEISDLTAVLAEESARIGLSYPAWIGRAGPADWQRLGERYLERTARWRRDKPRSTDKALSNWLHVGAAAAMLPGARFVHCRRDPRRDGAVVLSAVVQPGPGLQLRARRYRPLHPRSRAPDAGLEGAPARRVPHAGARGPARRSGKVGPGPARFPAVWRSTSAAFSSTEADAAFARRARPRSASPSSATPAVLHVTGHCSIRCVAPSPAAESDASCEAQRFTIHFDRKYRVADDLRCPDTLAANRLLAPLLRLLSAAFSLVHCGIRT